MPLDEYDWSWQLVTHLSPYPEDDDIAISNYIHNFLNEHVKIFNQCGQDKMDTVLQTALSSAFP